MLTFYQERYANEAFLRTATQRESIGRLARLIDYRLRPGVAALAWLAFTVDDGKTLRVPTRLRVQSVPGQDEQPQIFETLERDHAPTRGSTGVRVLPAPYGVNPLARGATGGARRARRSAALAAAAGLAARRPPRRLLDRQSPARVEELTRARRARRRGPRGARVERPGRRALEPGRRRPPRSAARSGSSATPRPRRR